MPPVMGSVRALNHRWSARAASPLDEVGDGRADSESLLDKSRNLPEVVNLREVEMGSVRALNHRWFASGALLLKVWPVDEQ